MIRNIYFDWGGTLAYSRRRDEFVNSECKEEKLSILYEDVVYILEYLKEKGYKMGIISNTRRDKKKFLNSLRETGLMTYFEGAIILSGEDDRYKKPNKEIFNDALTKDGIKGECAAMIGNNYYKDVIGGLEMNMYTVYVERNEEKEENEEKKYKIKIKKLKELKNYF